MPAEIEVLVLELRRAHRYWGARRLALELVRKGVTPAASESAVYRCLLRAGVIDPVKRHRRKEMWKRWERGGPRRHAALARRLHDRSPLRDDRQHCLVPLLSHAHFPHAGK